MAKDQPADSFAEWLGELWGKSVEAFGLALLRVLLRAKKIEVTLIHYMDEAGEDDGYTWEKGDRLDYDTIIAISGENVGRHAKQLYMPALAIKIDDQEYVIPLAEHLPEDDDDDDGTLPGYFPTEDPSPDEDDD